MTTRERANSELLDQELQEVKARLAEAEETLRAIHAGECDALVIATPAGDHVFTMKGADEVYRTFVERMIEGAVTLSADGTILYCNQRFAEIVGVSPERVRGSSIFPHVAPQSRSVMSALIGGGGGKKELWLGRADGTPVPVFLSMTAFKGTDPGVDFCMVVTDLSELKGKEEMTRLLATANQEIESFSYSVSHDLREPLRAINGFSRMLLRDLDGKLDAKTRRKFEVIREKAEKMDQLIVSVLTFTRLGRQSMTATAIDLEKLVTETWEELRLNHPECRAEINIAPLPPCRGDESMLRQVLSNLLANALKFSKGKEKALIEVGGENKQGECVYYVKDNGAGFDMLFAHKLFQLFRRLHSEEEFAGTGVGLSFVKRIIDRHGGRVWAEGAVNKGATFYFALPR